MMNKLTVYPYKPGSNSARDLAQALGVKRISHKNSRFRGNPNKIIINWGASNLPEEVGKCQVYNTAGAVSKASDKLKFFGNVQCRVPEWTTDPDEAQGWAAKGELVVERHVLNGHSGEGIELVDDYGDIDEDCPLFTLYVPKKQEYRVHVFQGKVIDVQRKARTHEVPDDQVNWKIRNNANGFIFARNGDALGDVPDDVLVQASLAVGSLGLDFGAADVVYNERRSLAYVLEVNTAPGLVGTTLENYVKAFNKLV